MAPLLSQVTAAEQSQLQALYTKIKPYFATIEGRNPLSSFDDITSKIPGIPVEKTHCLSIHAANQVVGHVWVLKKHQPICTSYIYLLANNFSGNTWAKPLLTL
ncbi:hypothetical protein [Levilactobacillus andaensis]|uniref:hypothetical protein n=1 Tax=Levilactobacillus andaensis TaxID=2799570 RepID=UPI0019447B1C|nr:hypothetical protein [Levilactobacillus andaensis]